MKTCFLLYFATRTVGPSMVHGFILHYNESELYKFAHGYCRTPTIYDLCCSRKWPKMANCGKIC